MKKARITEAGTIFLLSIMVVLFISGKKSWSLTLKDAVLYSLEHYPGLSARRHQLQSVEEDIGIATSYHFPRLGLESRYIKTDQPAKVFGLKLNRGELTGSDFAGAPDTLNDPSPFDSFVTSVNLEIPLFFPGVIVSRQVARRNFSSESYLYDQNAEKHAKQVVEAYIGVITARALRTAAHSSVKEAREHLKVAKEREGAGIGIFSDVLRAEVFLAQAKEHLIRAENGEKVSVEALRVAMGAPWEYEIVVRGQFDGKGDLLPLDQYIQEALRSRKDLHSIDAKVEMATYGVKFERASYIPDLALFGSYEINGSDSPIDSDADNYTVGVLFRWNIFDGLVRERKVKKAKFLMNAAKDQRTRVENQVRFEVKRAYLNVLEAKSRYEIALKAQERAEEGLRLVEGRYENSLSRLVELLDTQTALDGTRAQKIKAENDYFLSLKELDFRSGNFLEGLGIVQNREVAR